MFNFFVKKIAKRYLWTKRGEAFINVVSVFSIVGVALGVAVLNIAMAIMAGFESELHNKLVGSSHIYIGRIAANVEDYQALQDRLNKIPEITLSAPYVQGQVLLNGEGTSQGLMLKGILKDSPSFKELKSYDADLSKLEQLNVTQVYESTLADGTVQKSELPALFLGEGIKRQVKVYSGLPVSVLSPQTASSPFGLNPRYRRFMPVAFFKSGLSGYEESIAYTSLAAAQEFFRQKDSVTGFEITVKDPNLAPKIAAQISDILREQGKLDYYVQDWTRLNSGLWQAIKLEKQVYFIILLLLIALASFSIVTTLVMIVLEKRRDIAIMRTFGASAKDISSIFIYLGASIGTIGTLAGLILGFLGAVGLEQYGFPLPKNVFPTDTLPIKIEPLTFLVVAIASFIICLLATLYPARRAGKLNPSEILRFE